MQRRLRRYSAPYRFHETSVRFSRGKACSMTRPLFSCSALLWRSCRTALSRSASVCVWPLRFRVVYCWGGVCSLALRRLNRFLNNTLGGNLLQFVTAFLIWIVAEHLRVSAVLCTIALAMTVARKAELTGGTRMRVQSYAVWSAVVFTLNVFAFLLMGLQGRTIVARM